MIETISHLLIVYRYIIIFPVTIVEGPVVMMVSGVLLRLGVFSFIPLYTVLMIADLIGDALWYYFGRLLGHRFVKSYGKYFNLTEDRIKIVEDLFHRYHNWILLISKMTMGLGLSFVTLFTAGLVKIPFKRYILLNAVGGFVWTGFLLAIGYFLGNFYLYFNNILGIVTMLAAIMVVFFGLVQFGNYFKKSVLKKYPQN